MLTGAARHGHRDRALVIALLVSLVLWNLPFGGLLLYPFKLLATWMHEISHGVVMLLTGAGFERVEIYQDTSGLAFAEHGVGQAARATIAAAGYMGTPLIGAIMLGLAQTHARARVILLVLGALMGLSAVLFVSNRFGILAVGIGAAISVLSAALVSERIAALMVNFIAAQACINALLDIRVLFRANLVVNGQNMGKSDAHNMAEATFGSPSLWAALWLAWSFILLFLALRWVYIRRQSSEELSPPGRQPAEPPAAEPAKSAPD